MFIRPAEGRISSPFGMRTHPVTGKPSTMHWGIDIAKAGNVPILAAADGTVSRVQKDGTFGTYGNLIMIVHKIGGKTYETVYAHLRSYNVKVGQSVKAGQTIGMMGNTGGSTGQHLHFEVHTGRWNNKYSNAKNPVHYMIDPDVKVLQQLLVEAGHKISIDGINGPGTLEAIKAFQKANGLVVDGSAGPATMAALEKATKPAPPEEVDEVNPRLLNDTGREEAKQLIKKAVATGLFKESHLAKLDSYTDADLISYSIAYVNRIPMRAKI